MVHGVYYTTVTSLKSQLCYIQKYFQFSPEMAYFVAVFLTVLVLSQSGKRSGKLNTMSLEIKTGDYGLP